MTAQKTGAIGISVIIPVYKCRETLAPLVQEISAIIAQMRVPFEILLVDDDCPHDSLQEIQSLVQQYPFVRGIKLVRNVGQAGAISVGISQAKGAQLLVMDGDCQDPPEMIPVFYDYAKSEAKDIVFGQRRSRDHGVFRDFLSKTYSVCARVTGMPQLKQYSSYTLLSARAGKEYLAMKESRRLFVTALTSYLASPA